MRRQEDADCGDSDRGTHVDMGDLVAELTVSAAEKQQRLALAGSFGLLDLGDVNRMVAAVDRGGHFALEISERTVEDRGAVRANFVTDPLEFVAAADRELARQRFLVAGQYIDGEDFALLEAGIALGLLVHANQGQRRNQRDRRKRVGSQAVQLTRAAPRRDHGNAGREMTHHAPQFVLFDRHPNLSARGCYQTILPTVKADSDIPWHRPLSCVLKKRRIFRWSGRPSRAAGVTPRPWRRGRSERELWVAVLAQNRITIGRMKTLIERLQEGVADWRVENFPHDDFPAMAEILDWAAEPEGAGFRLRPPQLRALEAYWFLRLVEGTPKIAD